MEYFTESIGCFEVVFDPYNGVTVKSESIPDDKEQFEKNLQQLIKQLKEEKRNLLWIYLDIEHSYLIPYLSMHEFTFHTCQSKRLLMVKKIAKNPIIPTASNHTLGVGVVVINDANEVLVIQERVSKTTYKLPGGHIDDGEMISTAVAREVKEETGVDVLFESIISLGHFYPHQFDKSNLYIICKATPLSAEINITDTAEVLDAKWVDVDEYLSDDEVLQYNKELISLALHTKGLKQFDLESLKKIPKTYELFKLDKLTQMSY